MRDLIAALVAVLLLAVAAGMATRLHEFRRRRQRVRDEERALGRTIIAEVPTADDLVLFSADNVRFYYGDHPIDKDLIAGVRLLINGEAIARYGTGTIGPSQEIASSAARDVDARTTQEPVEGIPRDRWDVAIDTARGTTLVECGAIRERVSQELARTIFEAVAGSLERRRQGRARS